MLSHYGLCLLYIYIYDVEAAREPMNGEIAAITNAPRSSAFKNSYMLKANFTVLTNIYAEPPVYFGQVTKYIPRRMVPTNVYFACRFSHAAVRD